MVGILTIGTGFAIAMTINYLGITQSTLPGKITRVTFVAAHQAWRHWQDDQWNVHLLVNGEDGEVTLNRPPPAWAVAGGPVIVTFAHGRLYHDLVVRNLHPDEPAVGRPAP